METVFAKLPAIGPAPEVEVLVRPAVAMVCARLQRHLVMAAAR